MAKKAAKKTNEPKKAKKVPVVLPMGQDPKRALLGGKAATRDQKGRIVKGSKLGARRKPEPPIPFIELMRREMYKPEDFIEIWGVIVKAAKAADVDAVKIWRSCVIPEAKNSQMPTVAIMPIQIVAPPDFSMADVWKPPPQPSPLPTPTTQQR